MQTTPLAVFQKIGRSLLASSRAGTRLPIAVISAGPRALPLCPSAVRSVPCRSSRNLSETVYFIFTVFKCLLLHKKRSYPLDNFLVFIHYRLSYVGIIQIRFMGRRYDLPLSLSHKLPAVYSIYGFIINPPFQKRKDFFISQNIAVYQNLLFLQ